VLSFLHSLQAAEGESDGVCIVYCACAKGERVKECDVKVDLKVIIKTKGQRIVACTTGSSTRSNLDIFTSVFVTMKFISRTLSFLALLFVMSVTPGSYARLQSGSTSSSILQADLPAPTASEDSHEERSLQATCPATPPEPGTACDNPNLHCNYNIECYRQLKNSRSMTCLKPKYWIAMTTCDCYDYEMMWSCAVVDLLPDYVPCSACK
jgi:hypothetical protein